MAQHVDTTPKTDIPVQPAPIVGPRCPACSSVMWENGCKQRCTNVQCGYFAD